MSQLKNLLPRTTLPLTEKQLTERRLVDWFAKRMRIKLQEDWYHIPKQTFQKYTTMLPEYQNSRSQLLRTVYPEFDWFSFMFVKLPVSHWDNKDNQREFMDWVSTQLQINAQKDWYSVALNQISPIGKKFMYKKYQNSLFAALEAIYPQFVWYSHLFTQAKHNNNYINVAPQQRKVMDWIAEELGIQKQEDWYSFTGEDIKALKTNILENNFYSSLCAALKSIYHEFDWNPDLFEHVPKNHWKQEQNRRIRMDSVAEQLGIKRQEDWYYVPSSVATQLAPSILQYNNGNLREALQSIYPEFDW